MPKQSEGPNQLVPPKATNLAATIVATAREPMLVLDRTLAIRSVSAAFCRHFRTTAEDVLGQSLFAIFKGAWDEPILKERLEKSAEAGQPLEDFQTRRYFPSFGWRTFLVNARRIPSAPLLLVALEEVTRRPKRDKSRPPRKELLGLFIEHAPSALAMFDREMRYLYVSHRWRKDYGLENRRLLGVSHYEIFPEIHETWRAAHRRGLAGEVLRAEADRFERQDGTVQWFRWELRPWLDADGKVGGIIIFTEDVTEQLAALQALQASESRYRELVENAHSAILRWRADGSLTFFNEYAQTLFGYSSAEALGRHVSFLLPGKEKGGEDLSDLVKEIGRNPKRYTRNVNQNICRDGRLVWMSWTNRPVYDENGRIIEILSVGTDISELKETEEELRRSEQRFRQLADAMPQLVWTADPGGNVDYINERYREFKNLHQGESGQWNWLPVLHPQDHARTLAAWQAALRQGKTYQIEHRVHTSNHSYRWHLSRAQPVRDEQNKIIKWFGTATDIDDLKQTERELQEARQAAEAATRAKSDFLANMSHEIRTPMTIFLGALEHLLQIEKNPEHRTLLEMADKSARSLRGLINDILDFSQIEAGHVGIHETPFDLRGWVDDAVEMFILAARKKNLRLTTQVAEDVPAIVRGDPVRLGQVLTNLVGNAVKFTDQGEVAVNVEISENLLEFRVADTGIGIPEKKHNLLFKSFSQVDASFHRRHGGSGLGLAISKNLVELMGGKISFHSREGEGSTFRFTIPLKTIQEAANGAGEDTTAGTSRSSPAVGRILLAEDDPMIREVILISLARSGWEADTAASGREAVDKWRQAGYQLILMDLQMPEMDGLEATREIRRQETTQTAKVCIIGFTAHARQTTVDACLEAGMDDVLTKPVQMSTLQTAVAKCLPG